MKLVCVIASLGCGGAERTLSTLANAWAGTFDVTMLTFDNGREPPFFALDPRVVHRPLALEASSKWLGQAAQNNVTRVRRVRAVLRDEAPDVVVSFCDVTNIITLLAARPLGVPVVVSEQVDPRRYDPGVVWRLLRRATYSHAATVVLQTERTREYFASRTTAPLAVIPNPVAAVNGASRAQPSDGPFVLAVGRLEDQKGFDVLLQAFARMADRFSHWRLLILGEGPRRVTLEIQARQLGIVERLSMPGRVTDPETHYARADIFAMSSRFEGLPNALAEAMAHGCAVVSTDCPTGPAELIDHGVNGLLVTVEDVEGLTRALEQLADDAALRSSFGGTARQTVAKYRPDRVVLQWNNVLNRVAYRDRVGGNQAAASQ